MRNDRIRVDVVSRPYTVNSKVILTVDAICVFVLYLRTHVQISHIISFEPLAGARTHVLNNIASARVPRSIQELSTRLWNSASAAVRFGDKSVTYLRTHSPCHVRHRLNRSGARLTRPRHSLCRRMSCHCARAWSPTAAASNADCAHYSVDMPPCQVYLAPRVPIYGVL
jgi:hypothetical protein